MMGRWEETVVMGLGDEETVSVRRSGRPRVQPAWLSDPLISQNDEDLLEAGETPRRAAGAGAGSRAAAGGGGGVGGAHGRGLAQRSLQTPRQNAAQIFVSEGSVQVSAATAAMPTPSSAPPVPIANGEPAVSDPALFSDGRLGACHVPRPRS